MVVREAFAFGTPVAVSRLGPLPSIVDHGVNGVVFEPANAASLLQVVRDTMANAGLQARLAAGARHSFETLYNEQANYQLSLQIYERAIAVNKRAAA